jgi:hypothetical protein
MDDYKVANLVFDFARLIQPHPGIYSKRAIEADNNMEWVSISRACTVVDAITPLLRRI